MSIALVLAMVLATQDSGTVKFVAHHEGRGSDSVAGTWSGRLNRPDGGVIAIRLEHVARSASGLHALVFVSHDEMSRSFGADVAGQVTKAGTAQLAGKVNVGAPSGTTVQLSMELCTNADGCSGTIRFHVVNQGIPASVMQYPPQEFP